MRVIIFDLQGEMAHFRRPDTTSTQLTYPFITPTAVKGLVGAILGIEDFVTNDKIGIQLINPVRTIAQQMSMLGKDTGLSFNRPTTIELLINPAYRIYYAGEEYLDALKGFLEKEQAIYPTYLGCAYALTKPIFRETIQIQEFSQGDEQVVDSKTVVPTSVIKELRLKEDRHYCCAGGFMYQYKGDRTFERSIDFIYDQKGQSISFVSSSAPSELDIKIGSIGDEIICLC